jgi:hypothetical protein
MPTLAERARFATDDDLRTALTAAVYGAAVNVMSEPGDTPDHLQRADLARRVLTGFPTEYIDRFAWAASTNATVVDQWITNDRAGAYSSLDFVISTVWNAVAGITAAPPS